MATLIYTKINKILQNPARSIMMKNLILFAACLYGIIHCCSSSDPEVPQHVKKHDESLHQDLLAGGNDERDQLMNLSPENTAREIRNLVGRIDKNGDGKLDKSELVAWIASVEERHYTMEADEIFDKEDEDGDGFISFEEYWLNNESEEIGEDEPLQTAQSLVYNRFEGADSNGDHLLEKSEFSPFIHPFRYEHMIGFLIEDQMALYDHDMDGTISQQEYIRSFSPEEEPDENAEWVKEEKLEFQMNLDLNQDGMLNQGEMRNWLAPDDTKFHEEEALHLLHHVDKDKDDFLTVEEIELKFDAFVDSPVTDYGNLIHDEL